jgi:hypothetical protein
MMSTPPSRYKTLTAMTYHWIAGVLAPPAPLGWTLNNNHAKVKENIDNPI